MIYIEIEIIPSFLCTFSNTNNRTRNKIEISFLLKCIKKKKEFQLFLISLLSDRYIKLKELSILL